MTDIHERTDVECPYDRAASFLREHLARHATPDGRTARLLLRLPVSDVALERAVEVTLTTPLEHAIGDVLQVAWKPEGGGPYPAFSGRLVFAPEGGERCSLSLEGAYEPPGGALGKAFDAALGRRIASAGVRALLEDLRHAIEASYRESAARVQATEAPHYPPTYE